MELNPILVSRVLLPSYPTQSRIAYPSPFPLLHSIALASVEFASYSQTCFSSVRWAKLFIMVKSLIIIIKANSLLISFKIMFALHYFLNPIIAIFVNS